MAVLFEIWSETWKHQAKEKCRYVPWCEWQGEGPAWRKQMFLIRWKALLPSTLRALVTSISFLIPLSFVWSCWPVQLSWREVEEERSSTWLFWFQTPFLVPWAEGSTAVLQLSLQYQDLAISFMLPCLKYYRKLLSARKRNYQVVFYHYSLFAASYKREHGEVLHNAAELKKKKKPKNFDFAKQRRNNNVMMMAEMIMYLIIEM